MGVKRSGNLAGKMKGLTDEMRRQLSTAVYAIADNVKVDAQISITNGSVSGKGHVPSAPGQPPNNDTGLLADGIVIQRVDDLTAEVVSTAPYGADLELGTSKMEERPYMRPAAKANQARGVRRMEVAVEVALKGRKFRAD